MGAGSKAEMEEETLRHAFARMVTQFEHSPRLIDAIEAFLPEDLEATSGAELVRLLFKIAELYACGFEARGEI